jgi:hypothetical protein
LFGGTDDDVYKTADSRPGRSNAYALILSIRYEEHSGIRPGFCGVLVAAYQVPALADRSWQRQWW